MGKTTSLASSFLTGLVMVVLIVAVASCSSSRSASSGSFSALYDYESYLLHPEFRVYHFSADSSELLYRIKSTDLLYMRQESSNRPEAHIRIELSVRTRENSPVDSVRFSDVDVQQNETAGYLLGRKAFKLGRGDWMLSIRFTDLHRGVSQQFYLQTDKSNLSAPHYFLVSRKQDDQPLFNSFCRKGDSLVVQSAMNFKPEYADELKLGKTTIEEQIRLPPPPFSQNSPDIPSHLESTHTFISQISESFVFVPGEGIHFLTTDPEWRRGITLVTSSPFHPEIKSFDQLVGPLRYITSKSEFDELTRSSFPKPLVDNFWISCGGSKDRARDLIRTYYGRVEEANRYFSAYTEGWRTDRGMIHLIFGNATRIHRNPTSETWIYGEEGHPASLNFLFRKVNSPLSDNVYILQRDPMFRQAWEQMVTAWRQGRVYSD